MLRILLVLTVLCAVIAKTRSDYRPHGPPPYSRYKRIRHPGPPHKVYNRPNSHGFSHNPPRYVDDEPQYTETLNTKPKIKKPTEDLEEDLQSFVKHLSSQDLDKIVELAGRNRDNERYNKEPYEKHSHHADEYKTGYNTLQETEYPPGDTQIHNSDVRVIDLDPINQEGFDENYINDINYMTEPTPADDLYNQQNEQGHYNELQNIQQTYQQNEQSHYNEPKNTQETYQTYSEQESDDVLFSGIKEMPEVDLPLPLNLRDDFEAADTRDTPSVALPSYQVEDFGSLPLMNYHSKKDTLSSYHVPHYTVTSKSTYSAPPPSAYTPAYKASGKVPVEAAPPASAAKYQSDANQRAVKIWATRSKGWAYTLNDDGSLTLEKYGTPKYGHHR